MEEGFPINTIPNGLHRSRDPGAGAFSTYHNRESFATVPIQKGEELYVDYGYVTLVGPQCARFARLVAAMELNVYLILVFLSLLQREMVYRSAYARAYPSVGTLGACDKSISEI